MEITIFNLYIFRIFYFRKMSDSDVDVLNISISDNEDGPSKNKKCRRSYSLKQKLEAIEYARSNSISSTSRKFGLPRVKNPPLPRVKNPLSNMRKQLFNF